MLVSVIIVNYRVPYFLELCLHSVRKALAGLDAEIIVVDNHSADGGVDFLRPLFPEVNWIVNAENEGFSRANNRGLEHATGDYIVFLNPDTIVPEDFARKCLGFIQSVTPNPAPPSTDPFDPDPFDPGPPDPSVRPPGALGVRMIDGSGKFLKESRRGFPTPWVAFCKLSGLTALFPHSRRFARYYLGHLPADRIHPAPVLSGACFWVTRSALDKTGPFDETFFMYAEDIDLSYRLESAGYANYYFPEVTIIHFKGESTPKDFRHTRQFYKAMIQFRRKHFPLSAFSRALIGTGIWLRAALSAAAIPVPRSSKSRRTWLTGDPAGIARVRAALAASEKGPAASVERTAPDEHHAGEIIFCIGNEFSFKSAIDALERKDPAVNAAFYAAGCHAVISSSRRNGNGEIWIL
ncbi:MAG TPA: glycosyltransferase family 2 protein [Puia sp.]|nr:glycosyltransferase family 2 protein [Puia sp.]